MMDSGRTVLLALERVTLNSIDSNCKIKLIHAISAEHRLESTRCLGRPVRIDTLGFVQASHLVNVLTVFIRTTKKTKS